MCLCEGHKGEGEGSRIHLRFLSEIYLCRLTPSVTCEEMGAPAAHTPSPPLHTKPSSAFGVGQSNGLNSASGIWGSSRRMSESKKRASYLQCQHEWLIMILPLDRLINCLWARGRRPHQRVYKLQTCLHVSGCGCKLYIYYKRQALKHFIPVWFIYRRKWLNPVRRCLSVSVEQQKTNYTVNQPGANRYVQQ